MAEDTSGAVEASEDEAVNAPAVDVYAEMREVLQRLIEWASAPAGFDRFRWHLAQALDEFNQVTGTPEVADA